MSLKIDEISMGLNDIKLDSNLRSQIIKAMQKIEEEKKAERDESKAPKGKNKFVVVVRGDDKLAAVLQHAWVVKVKDDADENNLVTQMTDAARESNSNQKRKKRFINTFRDMFLYLKRAYSKNHNFQPVTKEAVRVVVLPSEDIKFGV